MEVGKSRGAATIATQNDSARPPAAGGDERPGPGPDAGADSGARIGSRIDQLLKIALQEQEREQAGFMKVLQASRDALNATRMELDHLRALVEGRDEAVLAQVDLRLERVARQEAMEELAANSSSAAKELAVLRKVLSTKLDSVVASLDAVDARTGEALAGLSERVDTLEQSVGDTVLAVSGELAASARRDEAMASALEERLATLERTLEARQQEVADAILKALDPVGRIMQLVQGRLARAASDLAVAQGSLLNRLLERDDRLERDRDRVLAELLNEFANGLKGRDRSRIGAQLLDADEERRRRRDLGRARPAAPPPIEYSPRPEGTRLPPPVGTGGAAPDFNPDPLSDAPWGASFGRGDDLVEADDDDPHRQVERYAGGTRVTDEWTAPNGAYGPGAGPGPVPGAGGGGKPSRRNRRPVL
ncbi:MAG TPA: hypothetical protein VKX24_03455 [Acidimicrobiia bacterium]|nr:hypothetical protein [Acidimicrobiia bacterium]